MTERDKFEQWAFERRLPLLRDKNREYIDTATYWAAQAWRQRSTVPNEWVTTRDPSARRA